MNKVSLANISWEMAGVVAILISCIFLWWDASLRSLVRPSEVRIGRVRGGFFALFLLWDILGHMFCH